MIEAEADTTLRRMAATLAEARSFAVRVHTLREAPAAAARREAEGGG